MVRGCNKQIDDAVSFSKKLQSIKNLKIVIEKHINKLDRQQLSTGIETILKCASAEIVNLFINDYIRNATYRWNLLILAAKHDHYEIVKLLLKKFNVNVEMEGVMQYDGKTVIGTTALWCAAASNHLNIVRLLVQYGANVNHHTRTHSTPLRAACFDGSIEIVKFLCDNGADVNSSNLGDGSNLMLASYKGHLNVVDYLLQTGANPNLKGNYDATALHYACERGHLETVKLLLSKGAISTKNKDGLTPLMNAAIQPHPAIVEYLTKEHYSEVEECIEAYELLASTYCNDGTDNSEKTYEYLTKAMHMRYADPSAPILKSVCLLPIEAYGHHMECQTVEDTVKIRHNVDALRMETLIIRERILGEMSGTLHYSIRYRGAAYAVEKRYEQALLLWLRAC
ncbi:unnamed protein product, partial [Didymodactylos carnosus]